MQGGRISEHWVPLLDGTKVSNQIRVILSLYPSPTNIPLGTSGVREYVLGVVESENNTNVLEGGVGAEEDIIGVSAT